MVQNACYRKTRISQSYAGAIHICVPAHYVGTQNEGSEGKVRLGTHDVGSKDPT